MSKPGSKLVEELLNIRNNKHQVSIFSDASDRKSLGTAIITAAMRDDVHRSGKFRVWMGHTKLTSSLCEDENGGGETLLCVCCSCPLPVAMH